MDKYTERLVKGRAGSDAFLVIGIGAVLAVGGLTLTLLVTTFGLFILALGIYVIVQGTQRFQVEFEYLITNGDIEVSKIIAKKSRKVVREIRAEDIKKMAPLAKDSVRNDVDRTDKKRVFDYTAGDRGDYYVAYESLKGTECLYILDLEGESLQLMKDVLKSAFEK